MAKTDHHEYTREELISICEQAIVPEKDWYNRDSQKSQVGVGVCLALLKAGCEFKVTYDHDKPLHSACVTDDRTIWLYVWSKGFSYFEYDKMEEDHFYLPTPQRLEECKGKDWY